MSLNVMPWPGKRTWERCFDICIATMCKEKWLIFQGVAVFNNRIHMSFYLFVYCNGTEVYKD